MNRLRARHAVAVTMGLAIAVAACGDDDDDDAASSTDAVVATAAPATTGASATTAVVEPTSAVETTTAVEGFLFTSPEGDYTIVMPGEPSAIDQQVTLPDGTSLPFTFHMYEASDFAAGVTRVEYPEGVVADLDGAVDGAVANLPGAELSSSEPIELMGREGREVVVNLDPGGADAYYLGRFYADGPLLYQVIYVGGDIGIEDPEIAAFFDSFQFTEAR